MDKNENDCLEDQVRLNYATVKKFTTPNLLYQKRILSNPEQGPSDGSILNFIKNKAFKKKSLSKTIYCYKIK